MTDIMKGAEPLFAQGNQAGVLVLRGFSGSPASTIAIALADTEFTIELPHLPGQGALLEELMQTRSAT